MTISGGPIARPRAGRGAMVTALLTRLVGRNLERRGEVRALLLESSTAMAPMDIPPFF